MLRLRLGPTPRLRSLIHTQRSTPSSAYLDPTRSSDASTSSTPDDLSSSQRRVLEVSLRVDQAGEVAANYIYAGQFAVLRRDPAAAALIQASTCAQSLPLVTTFTV
jgi:ubiquinone biosynthesis monooxygenase Coq7